MAKPPPVSHRWWCYRCGAEDEKQTCSCTGEETPKEDLGWRVGWNAATYVWYSTPPKEGRTP